MTTEFEKLHRAATNAKVKYNDAQRALDDAMRGCQHQWETPTTYTTPCMGNLQPDTRWWKRECSLCGKEETTTRYTETTTRTPKFD